MNDNPQAKRHPVVVDPAAVRGLSTEALASEETALVKQILELTPDDSRSQWKEMLTPSENRMVVFETHANPAIARLLGRLSSVRLVRGEKLHGPAAGTAEGASLKKVESGPGRKVTVTVALGELPPKVWARVIRRPEEPHPILVLSEAKVTPAELALGLRLVASTVKEAPGVPDKESVIEVRRGKAAAHMPRNSRVNKNYIDLLRNSPKFDIPGVGIVHATPMITTIHD